jgi:beta-glucanase (GH16 family)
MNLMPLRPFRLLLPLLLTLAPAAALAARATTAASASPGASATGAWHLVWADNFHQSSRRPSPANWTYDTGPRKDGNMELEIYCGYGSKQGPCNPSRPNAWVSHGKLHIVAREPRPGVYTSARLKTEGLRSFRYGRMEARIKIPRGQGMWPAFWMLGNNIKQVGWPRCGEFDIMENIGKTPATVYGSVHGPGFIGHIITHRYSLPSHADFYKKFHVYGMIWSPKKVQFYVDNPKNIYATETPSDLPPGARWPFDDGKYFFILNLAVGGGWPGNPDAATKFPAKMLVDWVRVYQHGQ